MDGYLEIVKLLTQSGADINGDVSGSNVFPPLLMAIQEGHVDVVKYLLDSGADVQDKYGPGGLTAMHVAGKYGRNAVIKLLAKEGANINSVTEGLVTPLMLAKRWGHFDTAAQLKELGADTNSKDVKGQTAEDYAYQSSK